MRDTLLGAGKRWRQWSACSAQMPINKGSPTGAAQDVHTCGVWRKQELTCSSTPVVASISKNTTSCRRADWRYFCRSRFEMRTPAACTRLPGQSTEQRAEADGAAGSMQGQTRDAAEYRAPVSIQHDTSK